METMKNNHKMFLTEDEIRQLMEGYDESVSEEKKNIENRNKRILKHFQANMLAISGAHK